MKRMFDFVVAAAGLLVLSPVMLLTAWLIKVESPGPIFFRQERVGKNFVSFRIYKFRTMMQEASSRGRLITVGNDARITRLGRFLRKTKIDELPQLINVLRGDMSLVGPRPEVPRYVEMFRRDYEEILRIRPGITDTASLKYQDEAEILGGDGNPEENYVQRILPDKIKLARDYVERSSFSYDLGLIFRTLPKLFGFKARTMDRF
jgi:lipopolysaccharide/colanic/teichoic acid biosynthesis glycosyltransferase